MFQSDTVRDASILVENISLGGSIDDLHEQLVDLVQMEGFLDAEKSGINKVFSSIQKDINEKKKNLVDVIRKVELDADQYELFDPPKHEFTCKGEPIWWPAGHGFRARDPEDEDDHEKLDAILWNILYWFWADDSPYWAHEGEGAG